MSRRRVRRKIARAQRHARALTPSEALRDQLGLTAESFGPTAALSEQPAKVVLREAPRVERLAYTRTQAAQALPTLGCVAEAHVSVYLRDESILVISASKTTAGFWVDNGEFEHLTSDVEDERLGPSIERMLRMSRQEVPVPDWRDKDRPNPLGPVYAAIRVRGWRGFAGRALLVSASTDGTGAIEIEPWKREQRPRSAFEPLPSEGETLDCPSQSVLGDAVRRAFSRSS